MPGKVKVKILSGRNLPVMDRGSDLTDAFVEIKLANITHKTDVCRKTLNPQWNSEWFRFELDDEELQDEQIQIRLMDYDTYSANDAIGKVNISLNPLLLPTLDTSGQITHSKNSVMSGFIPVFDTMNGIRGEVNVIVKVELFSDANKFRQSSCGVQFFHSSQIPHGFHAQTIHGFVEELIVNDDPEYQWIDKIRTPRSSNEARQVVFLRLSGQVQRKIGLKAIDLGANAVIGYILCFDLEGDVGVVARGIGTAVTLVKIPDNQPQTLVDNAVVEERTLKYLEFLTKNENSIGSNSIFDLQLDSSLTPDFVHNLLGLDTNINQTNFQNVVLTKQENDSIMGRDQKDIVTNTDKNAIGSRFRRRFSSIKDKMFNFKRDDLSKDRSPSSSSDQIRNGGLRMGTLLVRSIMATYISDAQRKKVKPIEKPVESKRSSIVSSESSSTTSSDSSESSISKTPIKSSRDELVLIDADNLCQIMRKFLEQDKIKDADNWIVSDDNKPTVSNEQTRNFDGLQKFLDGSDDDGFEIWIKPDLNDVDSEKDEPKSHDSLLHSLKEIIMKKWKHNTNTIVPIILPIAPIPLTGANDTNEIIEPKIFCQKELIVNLNNEKKISKPTKIKIKRRFTHKRSKQTKISRNLSSDDFRKSVKAIKAASLNKIGKSNFNQSLKNLQSSSTTTPVFVSFNKFSNKDLVPIVFSSNNQSIISLTSNIDNDINNYSLNDTNKMPLHALSYQNLNRNESATSPCKQQLQSHSRAESSGQSPAKLNSSVTTTVQSSSLTGKDASSTGIFRRSSDSDLSVTPKGNSLTLGIGGRVGNNISRPPINQENLDMLEYPFLTISKYPKDFIKHIGATVAARSVKLLERVPNLDEPETRDSWWTELRMEIRSHARALGCNIVIGYSEVTTISDDVCVLSATGTAAVINLQYSGDYSNISKEIMTSSLDRQEFEYDIKGAVKDLKINQTKLPEKVEIDVENNGPTPVVNKENNINLLNSSMLSKLKSSPNCTICHIPYNQSSVPFHVTMRKCAICKRGKVPDVIFVTIDIPENIQITGRGCFLQAQVCRPKRDLRSELNAKEISDGLPFLEYELHRVLINKLKIKGMNAIFGLKATVAIGERMMSLIATGTAVYLTCLPPAKVPKVVAGNLWSDMEKLNDLQKALHDTSDRNKEIYQLKYNLDTELNGKLVTSESDNDSDDEIGEMDLNFGNKSTCVLEVDDIEDLEIIASLMERCPPDGFHVVNTQTVPGLHDLEAIRNLQMFTQVWRAKFPINQCNLNFSKHFQRILQSIYFKLRRMTPCAICDLKYRLDFPETDEIQILVTGMALGLGEPKIIKTKRKIVYPTSASSSKVDDDLIFNLDEDTSSDGFSHPNQTHSIKIRPKSPTRCRLNSGRFSRHVPLKERNVDITPLNFIPGGIIESYLGNLNFFFIRESTSVKEIGGISGFVHSFITELLAICRAHVLALGGNAFVGFYMTELILVDNPHKNQGQCIISVGGDVVYVSYINDD